MKLYSGPLSLFSRKIEIALGEKGLAFEREMVPFSQERGYSPKHPAVLAVNPKGQVPVLQLDDGDKLTEGPAIVQYIADQKPESGLAPANGTRPRYHVQEWLNFVTSDLHKVFAPLFRPTTPEEFVKITKETLANKFTYLDKHLANKQYLFGDTFTVADAYCFVIVGWSKYKDIDLSRWPNLKAYMDRIAARPKVQEAMKAEGLIK